ncbi:MAG: tetratricopeptide repeat protein [Paludibacteraceae bacterium]|nr:tetratricopeptide repeat protein [Paludibacteraceae bacterium]
MKKLFLMTAVVLVSAGCFAQKSNVNKAKNLSAAYENPDFRGARSAIEEALEDPTTKDLANTWYVAGLVGYNEYQFYSVQAAMGTPMDEMKAGAAVSESYDYWLKADAMSQIPNEKGKVDMKIRKQIREKMLEYFQKYLLVNYGLQYYDKRNYDMAYEMFMKHFSIPELEMMQDEKIKSQIVKDTTYYTYYYYAGRMAYEAKRYDEAIAIFENMNKPEVRNVAKESDVIFANEFMYQCYVDQKDTANFVRVLQESMVRFPSESWFLQNLINYYIVSGLEQLALQYLEQAIQREPNVAQYHHIKGNLDENLGNYEAALADFDAALAIDPKLSDAMAGKGRVYYNQAVKINEEAGYIQDAKEYKKKLEEMNAMYRKSLPFFEEAHKISPETRDYMIVLKGLYYRFGMDAEYQAINDELNK